MAQPCCGGKLHVAPVPAVLMETPEDGQHRGHQPENLGGHKASSWGRIGHLKGDSSSLQEGCTGTIPVYPVFGVRQTRCLSGCVRVRGSLDPGACEETLLALGRSRDGV